MRSTTASIISCGGCATVTVQSLSAGGSEIGDRPIIGVLLSRPTCEIAIVAGTPDEPISTSTFSSSTSLRALRPALVGSEPSSSTISCTLRPLISGLYATAACIPLAYGTPSDELGPDSDTLKPTLRSAAIAEATSASAAATPLA